MLRFLLSIAIAGGACAGPSASLSRVGEARIELEGVGSEHELALEFGAGVDTSSIAWDASPKGVVSIVDGRVIGLKPGDAQVTASGAGLVIAWDVHVHQPIQLMLKDPPPQLRVGQRQPLHVVATSAGEPTDPGELAWKSTSPQVASVDAAGVVRGVSSGVAYISVSHGSASAMAEILVVEATGDSPR